MWRGNYPYLTIPVYLSSVYNTKQSEVVTVLACLRLRSLYVMTREAGCVVKNDLSALLRYPAAFPGKSGFHIRREVY